MKVKTKVKAVNHRSLSLPKGHYGIIERVRPGDMLEVHFFESNGEFIRTMDLYSIDIKEYDPAPTTSNISVSKLVTLAHHLDSNQKVSLLDQMFEVELAKAKLKAARKEANNLLKEAAAQKALAQEDFREVVAHFEDD